MKPTSFNHLRSVPALIRRAGRGVLAAARRLRSGDAVLPDGWWGEFERDFRAYTSTDWREAREAERQA
ncbi:MAG: hypothetical protein JOZ98_03655 [Solirubrobacterales bacterium]|nr:hypothetical protein [Solirubrobacterales bacterium]MBV9799694.1 hypothetical protein [Solirubrobacterales bacterium]